MTTENLRHILRRAEYPLLTLFLFIKRMAISFVFGNVAITALFLYAAPTTTSFQEFLRALHSDSFVSGSYSATFAFFSLWFFLRGTPGRRNEPLHTSDGHEVPAK
jgi:hypothetical protein